MKLNRSASASLLCLIIGCSSGFESDADELEYLSSLASPSASQFRRKKELTLNAERANLEEKRRIDESLKADFAKIEATNRESDAILERDRLAREEENEKLAVAALAEAEAFAKSHAGSPQAGDHYRKVSEDWPGTSQAWVASVRLKELEGR